MTKTVFILAASADIGRELARFYAGDGCHVVGTFRSPASVADLQGNANITLLPCDVGSPQSVRRMLDEYVSLGMPWDVFVSAVGVLDPIGPWISLDFDAWERSVIVNSLAQLRVLHGLYPHRRQGCDVHAAFFAGGGTNNPFTNYSAYCVGKIALIKMCELLDDEVPGLNAFIVGPGFVPTKIHKQTLADPSRAGLNFQKTLDFHHASGQGVSYRDIYECINWCVLQGRDVAGGRNVAVAHDPWQGGGAALAADLRQDRNRFKLRRAGNADLLRQGAATK